jgi:CheY-like chemotaxis protein
MPGTADGTRLSGLKVLLVDDNQASATSLARLLRGLGCDAQVRFDGTSALDCAQVLVPDVVILDIRLPDMAGTEVCRRLRAQQAPQRTVLVALTGATDPQTLTAVEQAGFDQILTKPVELQAILEVLARRAREAPLPTTGSLPQQSD